MLNMKNKTVLITGAAGTIGSALVKEMLYRGSIVRALDNNEDKLFQLKTFDKDFKNIKNLRLLFGDIRDLDRLSYAFRGVNYVFHAAALKHVELSEYNVLDCIETNVQGIKNIVKASINNKIIKAIFTSSDKAVNPTSTMGATKLIGERIFTSANLMVGDQRTRFSSVRFGNVLNSSGSVLQIFRSSQEKNKPFPITNKKMTRFFITHKGAVELCLYALSNMNGGEIFVRSMGAANIIKLAQAFAGKKNIDIKIVGLKSGEKLYEELITEDEALRTTFKNGYYKINNELSKTHRKKNVNNKIINSINSNIDNLTWQDLRKLIHLS